ncbi:hypothetical protein [Bacillus cereus]|uniref:hypothetical protein n=1 Tax=Bacillus cereus TaxID=1396 RepID=UPI000B4ADCB9|nr:hypothetical protein [Bacillus cereus]
MMEQFIKVYEEAGFVPTKEVTKKEVMEAIKSARQDIVRYKEKDVTILLENIIYDLGGLQLKFPEKLGLLEGIKDEETCKQAKFLFNCIIAEFDYQLGEFVLILKLRDEFRSWSMKRLNEEFKKVINCYLLDEKEVGSEYKIFYEEHKISWTINNAVRKKLQEINFYERIREISKELMPCDKIELN